MKKTRSRDLNRINHRLQGLTEKIGKTHGIVLAKRLNFGVRSIKGPGLDLCVRIWKDLGVIWKTCKTHKLV